MVWSVTVETDNGTNSDVLLWDSADAARQDVCAEIICLINDDIVDNDLDLTEPEIIAFVKKIEDLICTQQAYQTAIDAWNKESYDLGWDTKFSVYQERLFTSADADVPGFILYPEEAEADEDAEEISLPADVSSYQTSVPGATCRNCKVYNPDAYANKADGTYECYSCRTF
jgi:hypothetical protein